MKPGVGEEGCSLGKHTTEKRKIHRAVAGLTGNDAADADVGAWGLNGELLKAAMQPGGEVRPGRDQQMVGGIACGAPAAEAAGVEGGAVIKVWVGEEVAADHMGGERGGADLIDKGLEPEGLEAGVVHSERIFWGDVGG